MEAHVDEAGRRTRALIPLPPDSHLQQVAVEAHVDEAGRRALIPSPPDSHLQQVAVEVRVGDETRRHAPPTLRILKQFHQRCEGRVGLARLAGDQGQLVARQKEQNLRCTRHRA